MAVLLHGEVPVVAPQDPTLPDSILEGFTIGDRVGNPLYTVIDEHFVAAILLILAPVLIWLSAKAIRGLARRGNTRALTLVDAYAAASLQRRIAAWSIGVSAVIHGALVLGHELSWYTAMYALGAVALAVAGIWTIRDIHGRLAAAIVLGSVVTFWFLSAPADQLGIATKLLEIFALTLLAVPQMGEGRLRRMRPAGLVALIVFTGTAAWIGAFGTAGPDGGHHGGEYPEPGTVVPYIETLEPSEAESHHSEDLYEAILTAVEKYKDTAVAEAAGYPVGIVRGRDHHVQNPDLIGDGRILDPNYPETLIYAEGLHGPVLIGVMFEMDGLGDSGPMDAGPIIVWHSHDNVCFGLLPLGLAGLESPFGGCPIGSVNIPMTGEMLHAWTLPGVPIEDHWGHIDEEWLDAYLLDREPHS